MPFAECRLTDRLSRRFVRSIAQVGKGTRTRFSALGPPGNRRRKRTSPIDGPQLRKLGECEGTLILIAPLRVKSG